jgi:hypothetical protein
MNPKEKSVFGLLARFPDVETLVKATEAASQAGYRRIDAYSPFPVEALTDALRLPPSKLPFAVAAGGLMGAVAGYGMQFYATVIDMPSNIGGKPFHSWPAYIPITFELSILLAAIGGVLGLFVATRFPQPYHPVFNVEDFRKHGSQDGFYLGIEAHDARYDSMQTRTFLENLGAIQVTEIEE